MQDNFNIASIKITHHFLFVLKTKDNEPFLQKYPDYNNFLSHVSIYEHLETRIDLED